MAGRGSQTREKILATAAGLFARKGYHGASIRDLTQELGLQKSSLYNHFQSKEDLLFHLVDEFMDQALEHIEGVSSSAGTPGQRLSAFVRSYTQVYAAAPDRLAILINELDNLNPRQRRVVLAKERRYVKAIRDILEEAGKAGLLRDIPLSLAVFAFFGMVHYTPKWYRPDGKVDPEELGRLFETIFCQGVLVGGVDEVKSMVHPSRLRAAAKKDIPCKR